jgi:hypothetical protein
MSRIKLLSIVAIVMMVSAVTIATPSLISAQTTNQTSPLAKPPKPVKCNVIKIQVKVDQIPVDANSLVGEVTLQGKTLSKTVNVTEEADAKTTMVFNFKKFVTCPTEGTGFFGNVNGTNFIESLDSLKKPNKVSVSLPEVP